MLIAALWLLIVLFVGLNYAGQRIYIFSSIACLGSVKCECRPLIRHSAMCLDAKLRESLPEDMRLMLRFMGCYMAKRFDLAREMIRTFPEEMQATAQEALEDWSRNAESGE